MKLKDQVCSLELSKRLNELGMKKDSLFFFHQYEDELWETIQAHEYFADGSVFEPTEKDIPAFTVAELGEMLPEFIKVKGTNFVLVMGGKDHNLNFRVTYRNSKSRYSPLEIRDKSEAETRAKMLIYLIEKGLIEIAKP